MRATPLRSRTPWTTFADPEEILRRNREAGIDQSVIFAISNDTFEKANQEIADVCRRYPGHFIDYAKHDPKNEKGRIGAMLMHECHDLGLRGSQTSYFVRIKRFPSLVCAASTPDQAAEDHPQP